MPDLADGEVAHVQGSAEKPYELKNTGGVYSCSCPAWRNQRNPIERRTCKHLKAHRGEAAELARVGQEHFAGKPGTKTAAAGGAASASAGAGAAASKAAQKKETAPPVLLAHTWENDVDLTGWWMSEKLDGVRAYWDGSGFVSRLGNQFLAPDWFVAGLPAHPLDGELWIGRQRFQETISVVRRMDRSDAWKQVRYVLFDAPGLDGPFEARLDFLRASFPQGKHEFTHYLEHVTCNGLDHLRAELERVEGLGGEGLMLRKPGSRYVAGRSSTLLKVKSFYDAEARVVAHVPGKGKHKGRLGALDVELPDGTRFSVGTGLSEKEREDPPAIGEVITFRYQELTDGGVPRFPSYVGLAIDKTWPPDASGAAKPKKVSKAAGGSAKPAPAAASSKPAAKPVAPATPAGKRRFECVEGGSSKFWEVVVEGAAFTTTWGKLGGSSSSSKTKACADAAGAAAEAAKLVAEKVKRGYVEVGGGAPAPAPAPDPEDEDEAAEDQASDELEALEQAPTPAKTLAAKVQGKKSAPAVEPEPEHEHESDEAPPAPGPPRTTPDGIVPPAAHVPPPVRAAAPRLLRQGDVTCELAVVGDTVLERHGDRTVAVQLPGHGSAVANAEARLAARTAAGFAPVPDAPDRSPPPRYLVNKKAATFCELVVVGDTLVERAGPAGAPGRTRAWQAGNRPAAVALAAERAKLRVGEGFVEA